MVGVGLRIAKKITITILIGFLETFFIVSCGHYLDPEEKDNPQEVVWKLNKNVEGLRNLAVACMKRDSIAIFSIHYNEDGSVIYHLNMKDEGDIDLYSEIVTHKILVPELSMIKDEDTFLWSLNGQSLKDYRGEEVTVTDKDKLLSFILKDEAI